MMVEEVKKEEGEQEEFAAPLTHSLTWSHRLFLVFCLVLRKKLVIHASSPPSPGKATRPVVCVTSGGTTVPLEKHTV
jgi:hypothetical protein